MNGDEEWECINGVHICSTHELMRWKIWSQENLVLVFELSLDCSCCLQSDSVDSNEALSIDWVVVEDSATVLNVHGCQIRVVEGVWRHTAKYSNIAWGESE